MKKKNLMLLVLGAICIFSINIYAQNCGYDHGNDIGSYRGVIAYSNGSCTGYGKGDHQCTKYVSRFYKQVFGFTYYLGIDNASQFFGKAGSYNGFVAYPNNGTSPPKPDMILCYGGGNGGYGHVAIITEVGSNYIWVIEENVSCTNAKRKIGMVVSSGRYTVQTMSGYTLKGWLYFALQNVGKLSTGGYNQSFINFFNNNGGVSTFGNPTSQVHLWPDQGGSNALYVQDFWKGDIWCQLVLNPINNNVYAVFNKIS